VSEKHVPGDLETRRSGPAEPAFDVALELNREDRLESPQLSGFALELARLFRA
jgi:hypothetical protein